MENKLNGLNLSGMEIELKTKVLLSIDEHILPGDVLTLMGPSGSGKSSLLAYIGGFLDPVFQARGDVILDGTSILELPAHKRKIGILFQDPLLFPHLSVGENLLFAIPASLRGDARRQVADEALAKAELVGFFDRDPATLSGGQKARVALMRVLLSEPHALLLDEPFSKLDSGLRDQVRKLVFAEAKAKNLPVVLVTHDEADGLAASGKIIRLD